MSIYSLEKSTYERTSQSTFSEVVILCCVTDDVNVTYQSNQTIADTLGRVYNIFLFEVRPKVSGSDRGGADLTRLN